MSINMGLQLVLYLYYIFEHFYKLWGINTAELVGIDQKVKKDLVMFEEMMALFMRWVYCNMFFLILMICLDRYVVT